MVPKIILLVNKATRHLTNEHASVMMDTANSIVYACNDDRVQRYDDCRSIGPELLATGI